MSLVLDSSVTLAWFSHDGRPPEAAEIIGRVVRDGAVVPGIWRLEVMNALLTAQRRRRVAASQVATLLAGLHELDIVVDEQTDAQAWTETARIAVANGLTIYDAAYVELALRRALPIATFDREVRIAAVALAIPLIDGDD